MSKLKIELSPSLTGKTMDDFVWDWCKKISTSVSVSTDGCSLTERGAGIYIISNPNISEDTDFRIHLASDEDEYATGVFSPSDGDIAKQSYLEGLKIPPKSVSDGNLPFLVELTGNQDFVSKKDGKTVLTYKDGSQVTIGSN